MKNIYILCGGVSTEHEIALRSAMSIINMIDRSKYKIKVSYIDKEGKFIPLGNIDHVEKAQDLMVSTDKTRLESISDFLEDVKDTDYIIPVIHGTSGEDGQIQGFLDTLGIKYVGNKILSSAVCMDKGVTNEILMANNISQAKYRILRIDEYENSDKDQIYDEIFKNIGKSVFVKPANSGSSVGVNRAENKEELAYAIKDAFIYDSKILIEEEIFGVELEISVFGNEDEDIKASLPGSYSTDRDFFDYTAKYNDPKLIRNIPHKLSEEKTKEVRDLAKETYKVLGCKGFARIDIFMDEDEVFYVNEINTFPGMTSSSLSADLWKATDNTSYSQLLDWLIDLAEKDYERKSKIKDTRNTDD